MKRMRKLCWRIVTVVYIVVISPAMVVWLLDKFLLFRICDWLRWKAGWYGQTKPRWFWWL